MQNELKAAAKRSINYFSFKAEKIKGEAEDEERKLEHWEMVLISNTNNSLFAIKKYIKFLEERVAHFTDEGMKVKAIEYVESDNPLFEHTKGFLALKYYLTEELFEIARRKYFQVGLMEKIDLSVLLDEKGELEVERHQKELERHKKYLYRLMDKVEVLTNLEKNILQRPAQQVNLRHQVNNYQKAYLHWKMEAVKWYKKAKILAS